MNNVTTDVQEVRLVNILGLSFAMDKNPFHVSKKHGTMFAILIAFIGALSFLMNHPGVGTALLAVGGAVAFLLLSAALLATDRVKNGSSVATASASNRSSVSSLEAPLFSTSSAVEVTR